MFGPLLTLITAPIRVVATPIKVAKNLLEGETIASTTTDAVRYAFTGKENQETMKHFMDFSDDD